MARYVAISNEMDRSRPITLAEAQRRDASWDAERYHLARCVVEDGRGRSSAGRGFSVQRREDDAMADSFVSRFGCYTIM